MFRRSRLIGEIKRDRFLHCGGNRNDMMGTISLSAKGKQS